MAPRLVKNTFGHTLRGRNRRRGAKSKKRRQLLIEQLEDRFLMDGAGFIHTDPQPDPGSVVGVAGIEAQDDYAAISSATSQLRIDVLANDPLPDGVGSQRIKSFSATARGATVTVSDDGRRIIYTPPSGGVTYDSFYYIVEADDGKLGKANVTIGEKTGNWNVVHIDPDCNDHFQLSEDGGESTLDVLDNDGSFRDGEIVLVTFRVVDPLFAVDLSDPTKPTVEGALKIPGFSDYLHPVGEDYVIGIGYDADEITGRVGPPQISLFYVGDLSSPTLVVDRVTMEGAPWAPTEASCDHHAVALFAEHQVLTIPVDWTESSNYRQPSAIWTFQIDVDGSGGGAIDVTGSVEHEGRARRSVRIGEALVTVSEDSIKVSRLDDPAVQLSELYLGPLPSDDTFTVQEDSGSNVLDVRANDRAGTMGQAPRIVAVTQPVAAIAPYRWAMTRTTYSPGPVGVVEIIDHGRSLAFTPYDNFFGTATFTYTIFDEVCGEQEATVTIHVENVPEDPDAIDDQFQIEPGSTAVALDALANDVGDYASRISFIEPIVNDFPTDLVVSSLSMNDVYIQPIPLFDLTITELGPTSHGGTVTIDQFGRGLVYTPAEGFVGVETFTDSITTMSGRTDTAMVSVYVGVDLPLASVFVNPGVDAPPAAEPQAEMPVQQALARQDPTGPEREVLFATPPAGRPFTTAQHPGKSSQSPPATVGTHDRDLAQHRFERQVRMAVAQAKDNADALPVDLAFALADGHATTGLGNQIASELAASLLPEDLLLI